MLLPHLASRLYGTFRRQGGDVNATLHLTPHGRLQWAVEAEAAPLPEVRSERIALAFAKGTGHGLLHLGAQEVAVALPPPWAFWRDFAVRYVTALTATPEGGKIALAAPDALALETLCLDAPPMTGAEYLTPDVLRAFWAEIESAATDELAASGQTLSDFLVSRHAAWNLVGRVHFNLAENRKDTDCPFAFLATYTSGLSAAGAAQHLPLSQALAEFSGSRKKAQLLSLLLPVQKAAESCEWLAAMVAEGEIYHPLRWQVAEAVRFLKDAPKLGAAGIVVRLPRNWTADRPARPKVSATVGAKNPSLPGMDALLDFRVEVSLDGKPLTADEVAALLADKEGLQWIRGQWVEVDRERLKKLIARFQGIEDTAADGLPFGQAMRLLAGATLDDAVPADPDWSEVVAGDWLAGMLRGLRSPEGLAAVTPGPALHESRRLSRRLHFLRECSHGKSNEVFCRGTPARGAHGAGAAQRVRVFVGGGDVDRTEDRVHADDAAGLGQTQRDRLWRARRRHERRARQEVNQTHKG